MVSQKRDKLLSELEKDRLLNKDSLDSRTRAANNIRVKRKLSAWLKGIDDVHLILAHLPKEDIQRVANDDTTVLRLLFEAIEIMRKIGYRPIIGDVGQPASWQVITKKGTMLDESVKVNATDADIVRSANLTLCVTMLETMVDSENSPVSYVVKYMVSKNNPGIVGFLEENPNIANEYQKALVRLGEASKTMLKEREQRSSGTGKGEEHK
jgi:hypothetical protein